MANVLIVAYLLIVLALIAVILLQRSEGGGLGMGSQSSNGLVSVRGSANLLTRTTAILAALFFATAIGLTILSELDRGTQTILDKAGANGGAATDVLDALQNLQKQNASDLPVPADATTPATTTPDTSATPATTTDQTAPAATTTPAAPATDPGLAVPTDTAPAATTPETTPAAPAN
ncbi:preprotein translocase subunit SecG [Devosia sp.]|uniref:preprotein translocase subunit SecG n=1 Tax=Devosia sp. TaxID=1871048 RepID=UPI003BACF74A